MKIDRLNLVHQLLMNRADQLMNINENDKRFGNGIRCSDETDRARSTLRLGWFAWFGRFLGGATFGLLGV